MSTDRHTDGTSDGNLPTNRDDASFPTNSKSSFVQSSDQLDSLPAEALGPDPCRPLRHVEKGNVYYYALRPLSFSVVYILLIEMLERFSYYGLTYTQTPFLTGVYDASWNAGMDSVQASGYVSASTAIAYTSPFLGAVLADGVMDDYSVILLGMMLLYIPGCLLIALTTVPNLLGDEFNTNVLSLGLLVLYPLGAGAIKSVVNIFGARQYHPLLHSSLIESYYVNFYMCINIGALMGGILIPIVSQRNVTTAYSIPVACLGLGTMVFVWGTPRYVRRKTCDGASPLKYIKTPRPSYLRKNDSTKPDADSSMSHGPDHGKLCAVAGVSALIVPFCVVYSQMATTFKVQGIVMSTAFRGLLDAASMNNADAISVLLCGSIVGSYIYPSLARRNIRVPTAYKFALGSFCGVLAIVCALAAEYYIHAAYNGEGRAISILWQTPAYVFIGAGEIFAVSAAYEIAYTVAPQEKKALASAINLFFVGGIPNFFCIALYQACEHWFPSCQTLEVYTQAQIYNYFWVLLGIAIIGTMIPLLPPVKTWVSTVEKYSREAPVHSKWVKRQFTQQTSALVSKNILDQHGDWGEEGSLLELEAKHRNAYGGISSNDV